jgi:DNA polymerase III subunit epsilon
MVGPTIVICIALLSAVALALTILRARRRPKERSFANAPSQVTSQADPVEAEIARAIRQSVPERFLVFDLETTGLDPGRHEIIEIGAIKVNRDSARHDGFQCLVKPKKRISKRITQINGISQQMVNEQGEPLGTVLKDFAEFIGNLPLVSFNAEFDMGFLRASASRHGITIRNQVSCALELARQAWPGRESYKLCDLARDGKLPSEGAHRALEDCKRTIFVYMGASARLSSRRNE